jgi:DNA repair protein RecO (recombination protein O)
VRIDLHPAYVLHRRAYRETSLLLEVLSSIHGRVGLVARGVRKRAAETAALLQPFQPLMIAWAGRGELHTLGQVEPGAWRPHLASSKLISGFYLNELLLALLQRHDPHPDVYQHYDMALRQLSGGAAEAPLLRRFEIRLLTACGYQPIFNHDVVDGEPIVPELIYHYRSQHGPSRHWPDVVNDDIPIRGGTLLAMAAQDIRSAADLGDAKRLLRSLLAPYLGGRAIVSRSWYVED